MCEGVGFGMLLKENKNLGVGEKKIRSFAESMQRGEAAEKGETDEP